MLAHCLTRAFQVRHVHHRAGRSSFGLGAGRSRPLAVSSGAGPCHIPGRQPAPPPRLAVYAAGPGCSPGLLAVEVSWRAGARQELPGLALRGPRGRLLQLVLQPHPGAGASPSGVGPWEMSSTRRLPPCPGGRWSRYSGGTSLSAASSIGVADLSWLQEARMTPPWWERCALPGSSQEITVAGPTQWSIVAPLCRAIFPPWLWFLQKKTRSPGL